MGAFEQIKTTYRTIFRCGEFFTLISLALLTFMMGFCCHLWLRTDTECRETLLEDAFQSNIPMWIGVEILAYLLWIEVIIIFALALMECRRCCIGTTGSIDTELGAPRHGPVSNAVQA